MLSGGLLLNTLLLILSILLSLICVWLFWQIRNQKAQILQVQQEMGMDDDGREPELILTLQVVDPIAVARRESASARFISDHLPIMVKKMVYQEVMKELEKELEQREIDVTMQLEYR